MEYISGYNKEGMGQSTSAIDHEKVNAYHVARGLLDSMGYMVLLEEQYQFMLKELDSLTASRNAWKKVAETFANNITPSWIYIGDEPIGLRCPICHKRWNEHGEEVHSPACPITQLRDLQRSEG